MATAEELAILLSARNDTGPAFQGVTNNLNSTQSLASRAFDAAASAARDFAIAVGVAGVAIAGALALSVKTAGDFEQSMLKIGALAGVGKAELDTMGASVVKLSTTLPQSAKELADGLFFVVSAGFSGQQAMQVLETSARAAASGLGSTKVVADAVTSVLNAYKLGADQASHATDILTAAVTAGKTEAADFAPSIGRVLPIAAAVGVSFEQVAASMATMTRVGLNADEASTALRGTLGALENPGKAAKTALEGIGFSAASLKSEISDKGLLATLTDMMDRTGGNIDVLEKIIPNIRALTGVLATAGSQGDTYKQILDSMQNSAGATDRAFAVASAGLNFQLGSLHTSFQALEIVVGNAVIPAIIPFIKLAHDVLNTISDAISTSSGIQAWGQSIVGAFQGAAAMGETWLVMLKNISGTYGLGLLQSAVISTELMIRNYLGDQAGNTFHSFIDAMNTVGRIAAQVFRGDFAGAVASIQTALAPVGSWLLTKLQEWGNAFLTWITPRIPGMMQALGDLATRLLGWFETQVPAISIKLGEWGIAFINWVGKAIPPMLAALGDLAAKLLGNVDDTGVKTGKVVADKWSTAFSAWVVTDAVPALVANLPAIEIALNAFALKVGISVGAAMLKAGEDIGFNIWRGIVNGMTFGLADVAIAGWNIGHAALTAAQRAVDGHSPSLEFMRLGQDITAGLAMGITDSADTVMSAMDTLASALGATFDFAIKDPIVKATKAMNDELAVAQREHGDKMHDLTVRLGEAQKTGRQAILDQMAQAERDYQQKVGDIQANGAERIVQAERDLAEQRGQAIQDFQSAFDDLNYGTEDKLISIGQRIGENINAAINDAAGAIQDAKDAASKAIQDATESQGLNRLIRGQRDVFTTGQTDEARKRSRLQEDNDLVAKHLLDEKDLTKKHTDELAKYASDVQKSNLALQEQRARQDADNRYQLEVDLKNATSDDQKRQIEVAFNQHQDALKRSRSLDDKARAEDQAETKKALQDKQTSEDAALKQKEADEIKALADRRKREDDDRSFSQMQAQALQDFNDKLENDALNRQINRITDEENAKIAATNEALAKKQASIEKQADDERAALAVSYGNHVKDLQEKFVDKIGPLTGEAQTALGKFLDEVAAKAATISGAIIAGMTSAVTSIGNVPGGSTSTGGGGGTTTGGGGTTTGGGSSADLNPEGQPYTGAPIGTINGRTYYNTKQGWADYQAAQHAGPGACFAAGTLVATPGGRRAIETLVAGDAIYRYDAGVGAVLTCVEAAHVHENRDVLCLVVDDVEVLVTPEHPFLTPTGWVPAGSLTCGSALVVHCMKTDVIRTVQSISREPLPITVYNVTVEAPTFDTHNYLVADGLIVHNAKASFAGGGIVPGPLGSPMEAIVHGGEIIIDPRRGTASGAGTQTLNLTLELDGSVLGRATVRYIQGRAIGGQRTMLTTIAPGAN